MMSLRGMESKETPVAGDSSLKIAKVDFEKRAPEHHVPEWRRPEEDVPMNKLNISKQVLQGGERGQGGAADPHRVLALRGSDDLDLRGAGCQGCDLLLHPVGDAWVRGSVLAYRSLHFITDATGFHARERGLEECLGQL
ncbi:hypothetical protein H920_11922 [Fukomys damarensis]|uniref:Uncharacterized protein n=1 Tax=Fukomys damarensis TaxID=885580 RepID=A0A091D8X5_FUKDA|nr:hypothetical protein H920_11922 [Fukomys damarensis]